ncbi:MAG: PKD domain-containing protein [Cytophagales bacterium]|nr:MAG: PKD domain-containing protein [Cytophagales bacterium]
MQKSSKMVIDSYIAFVVTNVSGSGGNIHRLNFGSSLSNTNPTNTNLGNFGIIGQRAAADPASLSIEITKDNSKSYVWVVNRFVSAVPVNGLYNQLIKLEFPNVCNADISGSSSATPTNNFYIGGNYNITLNIYRNDNRSLVNSYGQTLTVKNATVGNFTVSGQCLGETTNFNNTSAGSESNVSSWLWDFGDGTTSTAKNPTKQYTNTGVYSVKLTVNNVGGCTNTITKNITIRNYPNATFSKIGGCVNEGVRFINESANNTNIINRVWTFSDGSTFFASPVTDLDTTKFFNSVGEYEVMLTVTNDAGCVSTSTMKINIGNKPVADFNFSNACERVPIQFSDVSQAQSIGESIVAWQWNFGISGANSTLKNPTYTYNNVGNYTVSLTAFSSTGCSAQVTKLISLKSSLTSSFSTNDTLGLPPFTAKFNNQNTNAVSYVWDFGNGVKSTDASPSYTYTSAGDYVVKYQALNLNGCGTIVSKTIKVLSVTDLDVNTTALPAIRTYPNPATERLFLQNTTSELFQLRIFNTQGVLIHSIILDAKDTQMIDVNNWSSGVYMIVAEQKGIVSSYRVMVHQ